MLRLILSLTMLLTSSALAQTAAPELKIVRGVVVKQVHGCEMDAACSVIVKTDTGEEAIVWNQGNAMPPASCRDGDVTAATEAEYLLPGDRVEIHVRLDTRNMLCGPGASVTRLDLPDTPARIIHGIVVRQNRDCGPHRPDPCSVTIRTDRGDEILLWRGYEAQHPACRKVKAAQDALALVPGDEVAIRIPASSGDALCGDGASVTVAADPVDPQGTRIVRGIVIDKDSDTQCDAGIADGKTCTMKVRTDIGEESFIWSLHGEGHPLHCSFGDVRYQANVIARDDLIEIHLPVSSGNMICGNGAKLVKLQDNSLAAKARTMPPAAPSPDPSIRVVRGIVDVVNSSGIFIETGNGKTVATFGKQKLGANPTCETPQSLIAQAMTLKQGDMVELHIPQASEEMLCGEGASVTKLP